MNRVWLSVLVVGLFVGQAWAGMFSLDYSTAATFRQISVSPGDTGFLDHIINQGGTTIWPSGGGILGDYEDNMSGALGFVGILTDKSHNGIAWMRIGATVTGTYDGFTAYIENDDQSTYNYRLFLGDGTVGSSIVTLGHDEHATLSFTFGSTVDPVLGFEIIHDDSLPLHPSNSDVFYTSVVPVPAGVLLGFLGLTAAGLGLRKLS